MGHVFWIRRRQSLKARLALATNQLLNQIIIRDHFRPCVSQNVEYPIENGTVIDHSSLGMYRATMKGVLSL